MVNISSIFPNLMETYFQQRHCKGFRPVKHKLCHHLCHQDCHLAAWQTCHQASQGCHLASQTCHLASQGCHRATRGLGRATPGLRGSHHRICLESSHKVQCTVSRLITDEMEVNHSFLILWLLVDLFPFWWSLHL